MGIPNQVCQFKLSVHGKVLGLVTDEADELARVFLSNAQSGVDHGPQTSVGDEPLAIISRGKLDCFFGAEPVASRENQTA